MKEILQSGKARLAFVSAFQSRQAELQLRPDVSVEANRLLASRLHGYVENLFPRWTHRRARHRWERRWLDPEFSPFWKTDRPQEELVDAVESGWFPKNERVIDLGCGNGEASRWLASQGFAVLGLDYCAAAIRNCRRLSAGDPNAPAFELADLCDANLELEPTGSLIDRGCFHRTVESLRPVFARNIAQATAAGGHFLLLAGTFQDARLAKSAPARTAPQLREHVDRIFGNYFVTERAEPALLNAREGQQAAHALAFWMVRRG